MRGPTKRRRRDRWLLLAGPLLGACVSAGVLEPPAGAPPDVEAATVTLDRALPGDPAVRRGRLANGLRYAVRGNHRPEDRAELRLVVKAGSLLEDEDQRGLAHFVEHMAFNGTRRFEKQELVESLRAIGMRFGADLNASTGFEQTIYQLQVPTDDDALVERALLILHEWAQGLTFDPEEIDRERGVVIEEWRGRRGAGARVFDRQLPVLLAGSRHAERLPIGVPEVLSSFEPETLVRYYRDWYRPDLMAVVAVGDFDPDAMVRRIVKRFSKLRSPPRPRAPSEWPVPERPETAVSRVKDPELTVSRVQVSYKHPARSARVVGDFREGLVEGLFTALLNARLRERLQEADPPFLGASSSLGSLTRDRDLYSLSATVHEGRMIEGLAALLEEAERARLHGFQPTELERMRADFLRSFQRQYEERDTTPSAVHASRLVGELLEGDPTLDAATRYRLAQRFLPEIALEEVNDQAARWMSAADRVILVTGPEKEGAELPEAEALVATFERVREREVAPYEDRVADGELMPQPPAPGRIASRDRIAELDVEVWRLDNDVRVVLKPTDFKKDEIRLSAFSPGGTSLAADDAWVPAVTATSVLGLGGLGDHDLVTLQKLLSGKSAGASAYIGETSEGLAGGGSPQDLETIFQLVHLTVTAPRADPEAFASYRSRMAGLVANRRAQPEVVFQDTLSEVMSQGHPRRRPFDEELLARTDLEASLAFYRERFADFSDATFVMVGAFSLEQVEPLVERYLASLPGNGRRESWRDLGVRTPRGVIERTVRKGLEPKAQVVQLFTGPFEQSWVNRHRLQSLVEVLQDRLRQRVREELGGTYGVSVSSGTSFEPVEEYTLRISFSCDPERVDDLRAAVREELERIREAPVDAQEIRNVQETQRRARETALEQNGFWASVLGFVFERDLDPLEILRYEDRVASLDADELLATARRTLDFDNVATFLLLPEAVAPAEPGERSLEADR
ncbi:MAG TPA: insulinase family protein [Thermoanaerobaculia bacterium]|nr:insulinase family protein [Thermoanaerobaculia bacterium]